MNLKNKNESISSDFHQNSKPKKHKKPSQVTFIKIINLKSINKSTLGNFHLDNTPKYKKQVSSTYDTLKKRCIKIVDIL